MSKDEVAAHPSVCFESSVKLALAEITEDFKKENKLSASSLLRLRCLFGATFDRALELCDQEKVTECKVDESKTLTFKDRVVRSFYEVQGQSSEVYAIFPDINFCSCLSFENQVLKEHSTFTCKHVLAVWLTTLTQTNPRCRLIQESEFCETLLSRVLY